MLPLCIVSQPFMISIPKIGKEIYDKYGFIELEITDQVFQKYSDIIFQEAENRMHSIKAIMYNSLKNI